METHVSEKLGIAFDGDAENAAILNARKQQAAHKAAEALREDLGRTVPDQTVHCPGSLLRTVVDSNTADSKAPAVEMIEADTNSLRVLYRRLETLCGVVAKQYRVNDRLGRARRARLTRLGSTSQEGSVVQSGTVPRPRSHSQPALRLPPLLVEAPAPSSAAVLGDYALPKATLVAETGMPGDVAPVFQGNWASPGRLVRERQVSWAQRQHYGAEGFPCFRIDVDAEAAREIRTSLAKRDKRSTSTGGVSIRVDAVSSYQPPVSLERYYSNHNDGGDQPVLRVESCRPELLRVVGRSSCSAVGNSGGAGERSSHAHGDGACLVGAGLPAFSGASNVLGLLQDPSATLLRVPQGPYPSDIHAMIPKDSCGAHTWSAMPHVSTDAWWARKTGGCGGAAAGRELLSADQRSPPVSVAGKATAFANLFPVMDV